MKITAFQTLELAVHEGTLAAAAAAMHLTPSAVSMQMKQLELYLGQPLFDRSGLQVRPTPAALEVLAIMSEPLRALARLRRRTDLQIEGTLVVGVIPTLQPTVLPATLKWLAANHHALHVQCRGGKSSELINAVKSGAIDAALVARPEKGSSTGLNWQLFSRHELVLLIPPDCTETDPKKILQRLSWVRYNRNTATGLLAHKYVREIVPNKRSEIELDDFLAVAAHVNAGLGFAVVPVLNEDLNAVYPIKTIKLGRKAPRFDIALVSRKADQDSRLHSALCDALRQTDDGHDLARQFVT
jgi:DNA-binding transcriptional LysR family regulator